jgi:hypothetical protein
MTRLQTWRPSNRSIPGRGKWFFFSPKAIQTGSGARPAFCSTGTGGYFSGGQAAGVADLTAHLHLLPRLWISGGIPLLPPCMPSWLRQSQPLTWRSIKTCLSLMYSDKHLVCVACTLQPHGLAGNFCLCLFILTILRRRSQWSRCLRRGSAARPFACWDCGFEFRRGHGYLSVVNVVCCQVQIFASGWSLVQSSPTEYGVSNSVWSWSFDNEEALAH